MSDGDENAGTAASAIGLAVLTGLEKVWTLFRFINSTRDMIANHITSGAHTIAQITGLSDALDAKQDDLGYTPVRQTFNANTIGLFWNSSNVVARVDSTDIPLRSALDGNFGDTTITNPHALNNPVSSGYFALYVNGDGRYGRTPSARKYKSNIKPFRPDPAAGYAIANLLREFTLKAAVKDLGRAGAPLEHGLIADELAGTDLDWLVLYVDGEPEGIAYEKVALALAPAIADLNDRLAKLEARDA